LLNEPVRRTVALDPTAVTCTLVSLSCTTAWTDWMQGELWLCPDGLLRKARGWLSTVATSMGGSGMFDHRNRPTRLIGNQERARIAAAGRRNWWISWDQISSAKLESGPMSHAVHMRLTDGRKVSLRWLRSDGPTDFVRSALEGALGARFAAG
jgi:hypothetical protein